MGFDFQAAYDELNPADRDYRFYAALAASAGASSAVDLGCGTGTLALMLAAGGAWPGEVAALRMARLDRGHDRLGEHISGAEPLLGGGPGGGRELDVVERGPAWIDALERGLRRGVGFLPDRRGRPARCRRPATGSRRHRAARVSSALTGAARPR